MGGETSCLPRSNSRARMDPGPPWDLRASVAGVPPAAAARPSVAVSARCSARLEMSPGTRSKHGYTNQMTALTLPRPKPADLAEGRRSPSGSRIPDQRTNPESTGASITPHKGPNECHRGAELVPRRLPALITRFNSTIWIKHACRLQARYIQSTVPDFPIAGWASSPSSWAPSLPVATLLRQVPAPCALLL